MFNFQLCKCVGCDCCDYLQRRVRQRLLWIRSQMVFLLLYVNTVPCSHPLQEIEHDSVHEDNDRKFLLCVSDCASGPLCILAISLIALTQSYELEPAEGGQWHRRLTTPRYRPNMVPAPVIMPAVHSSAVIPKPVPSIAPTPPTVYQLPSSLVNSFHQQTQTRPTTKTVKQSSRPAAKKNDFSWVKRN